jgi:hypothetical protein
MVLPDAGAEPKSPRASARRQAAVRAHGAAAWKRDVDLAAGGKIAAGTDETIAGDQFERIVDGLDPELRAR